MIKSTTRGFSVLLFLGLMSAGISSIQGQDYEERSPFSAVRWNEEGLPEAKIDETWYAVQAINDIAIRDIVDFCIATWPARAQKRFDEDLVEVLGGMNQTPEEFVRLKVINLATGKEETLSDVPMTRENRQAVQEWRDFMEQVDQQVRQEVGKFDVNKDGSIQLEEISGEHDRARFRNVDTDGDHVVTRAELETLFEGSYEGRSPFSAVRWNDAGLPEAEIDETWYAVRSINDIAINKMVEFCKSTWDSRAQKRFEEDMVEVLGWMKQLPKESVTLKVINLETGKEETLSDVPMTSENRRAIRNTRNSRNGMEDRMREVLGHFDANKDGQIQIDEALEKKDRICLEDVDADGDRVISRAELELVFKRKDTLGRKESVTIEQAIADIDDFQLQLESRFAYLNANNVDYRSALEAVKTRILDTTNEVVDVNGLEAEIGKVVSMFIDGHAGPRGFHLEHRFGRLLPFLLETAGDRFVAVNRDRKSLVDAEYPYVVSMDGIDLERWLAAMDPYVNQGSPQHTRRRCARYLEFLDHAREKLGLPAADQLKVELASSDGTRKVVRAITLTKEDAATASMSEQESRILDGNIGYLRLPTFGRTRGGKPNAVELIRQWMPQFRDTTGLIVDVRDNGGGSRDALLELFPYLFKTGEAHVGNVCAYRLYLNFDDDQLEARHAYRETDQRWDAKELATIKEFKSNFQPEWTLPADRFSDWHYLVVSRRANDPRYCYDKPVVLLTNSYCFSATDIFVGAFKGFRNVTIMGQSTGGGSARTEAEFLPNSGLQIRLASMASFQPGGLLYDGRGVAADVQVDPSPDSFLIDGEDNILGAASKFLSDVNQAAEAK